MHDRCMPDACQQHAGSTPTANQKHAGSAPGASQMHAGCTPGLCQGQYWIDGSGIRYPWAVSCHDPRARRGGCSPHSAGTSCGHGRRHDGRSDSAPVLADWGGTSRPIARRRRHEGHWAGADFRAAARKRAGPAHRHTRLPNTPTTIRDSQTQTPPHGTPGHRNHQLGLPSTDTTIWDSRIQKPPYGTPCYRNHCMGLPQQNHTVRLPNTYTTTWDSLIQTPPDGTD